MQKGMQQVETDRGTIPLYVSLPEGQAKGGLIVIHEVWGLLDHIKDVADRFAAQGFVTVAPDLLAGTALEEIVTPQLFKDFSDPERSTMFQVEFRKLMTPLQSPEFAQHTVTALQSVYKWLKSRPETGGKVAVVGFCFGGTYGFELAGAESDLVAAVPFYGHASEKVEDLQKISCSIMAFYGENDANLMEQLPSLEKAMQAAGVDFRKTVYPEAGHAFFNDANPTLYKEGPAKDAWQKTLSFLDEQFERAAPDAALKKVG